MLDMDESESCVTDAGKQARQNEPQGKAIAKHE
jgi:hypothetical protein